MQSRIMFFDLNKRKPTVFYSNICFLCDTKFGVNNIFRREDLDKTPLASSYFDRFFDNSNNQAVLVRLQGLLKQKIELIHNRK